MFANTMRKKNRWKIDDMSNFMCFRCFQWVSCCAIKNPESWIAYIYNCWFHASIYDGWSHAYCVNEWVKDIDGIVSFFLTKEGQRLKKRKQKTNELIAYF